ncbi:UNVERIFIED_CONTAM: hypothetical protein HDU68_002624 [Siphonaria sp. JEL0065]|nr:hypothetical protein HDU68_002624 [Siphonaria sp. JEL0065]
MARQQLLLLIANCIGVLAQQTKPAATSSQPFILGTWFFDGTPASWNAKMGKNYPSFQAAENIPYALSPDKTQILLDPNPLTDAKFLSNVSGWDDGTDASAFITIYNYPILANGSQGLDLISNASIIHLAQRLGAIQGRETFLRWLPEMNGDWMPYGPPTAPAYYVRVWKTMYEIIKQYSPNTQVVWSPNFDLKPGNTAYWPGPQYVDWVGTSVYYKGFGYNNAMPPSYISDSMSTVYNEYAVVYQKPFVISECSGAWETGPGMDPATGQRFTNVTSSVDQVAFQQYFWAPLLSQSFLDAYPLLRGAYIFEEAKQEEFFTDFRVSNDTLVRAMFQGLVDTLDKTGHMTWASPTSAVPTTKPVASVGPVATTTVATKSGAVPFGMNIFLLFAAISALCI